MNECFVLFPGSSTSWRVKIDFFQWEFIALKWGPAPKMGLRQSKTLSKRLEGGRARERHTFGAALGLLEKGFGRGAQASCGCAGFLATGSTASLTSTLQH